MCRIARNVRAKRAPASPAAHDDAAVVVDDDDAPAAVLRVLDSATLVQMLCDDAVVDRCVEVSADAPQRTHTARDDCVCARGCAANRCH
jgi:hypothetical protein